MPVDFSEAARALIQTGDFFFQRGWVPATSGNFSVRLDAQHIAITVSGRHKGKLKEEDIMMIDHHGHALSEDKKPSAETPLHTALYRYDSAIGAVLHTHSSHATVLSLVLRDELRLCDYEVVKAFSGIDSHECEIIVPIFANDQETDRLAKVVMNYLDRHPGIHGYLIAGHGFYTWGASLEDACRHIEAFEFLFECELLVKRMMAK